MSGPPDDSDDACDDGIVKIFRSFIDDVAKTFRMKIMTMISMIFIYFIVISREGQ